MTDPQLCVDELRKLAEAGSGDPRKAAAKVVHVCKHRVQRRSAAATRALRRHAGRGQIHHRTDTLSRPAS
jgi:hypothetical protein